ncbi:glutathione ABC transporter ATP binding subunit GsiA [Frankia sp. AiPs1]|uniref:dipeptide ABC transporter ATP-binding protein n=1 Tax=Frankia sp. AiPa1 TaxID=573492 RepID=UPI00202B1A0F|nr:ABC transporter ATP-binding protein [Frankia sp. AiPa1]MCL9760178.1 ABC transporter ATP-binding protein [Frankia sp. AiPa1]
MSLVEVAGLTVAFGHEPPVVRDVSFSVEPGECLALVGESGSGKSVTARSLLGLAGSTARVGAETLNLCGHDARPFAERDWRALRGRHIGMVLQDALTALDPLRRIEEEVAEPLRLHRRGSSAEQHDRVLRVLAEVGIPDPAARSRQYPHQLSGGLRQRALIASALVAEPDLVIADEPTTALDVLIQDQILTLLGEVTAQGRGMVLISHDLAVVARLADRIAVMRHGSIVEIGLRDQVIDDPRHPYTKYLLDIARRRRDDRPAVPESEPVVTVDRVTRSFGGHRAVADVSLSLRLGQTVGLVGESGSGKSTLARMVMGLTAPDTGRVLLHGGPWSEATERARRRRRRRIQLIQQDPHAAFDPRHTVSRIIAEALPDLGRRARRDRTTDLLATVGLDPGLAARRPHQLSGGQRQRVAIARALAVEPEVLVCDEPVSALDVSVQAQILDLLADLQRRLGIAMLFITHDLTVVAQISDQLAIMRDGEIVEEGDTKMVFDNPRHPYTRALLQAAPRLPGPGEARTNPRSRAATAPHQTKPASGGSDAQGSDAAGAGAEASGPNGEVEHAG